VAEISVAADETGAFSSRLDLPEGVPSGRYILEAVGVEGSNTHIGSQTIYLGWPPIGVIFLSLEYWWAVFSLLLLGMLWYFRRGRISRKRIGTPNVPEYSPTVASSGSAK
jgi:hypothetical protein